MAVDVTKGSNRSSNTVSATRKMLRQETVDVVEFEHQLTGLLESIEWSVSDLLQVRKLLESRDSLFGPEQHLKSIFQEFASRLGAALSGFATNPEFVLQLGASQSLSAGAGMEPSSKQLQPFVKAVTNQLIAGVEAHGWRPGPSQILELVKVRLKKLENFIRKGLAADSSDNPHPVYQKYDAVVTSIFHHTKGLERHPTPSDKWTGSSSGMQDVAVVVDKCLAGKIDWQELIGILPRDRDHDWRDEWEKSVKDISEIRKSFLDLPLTSLSRSGLETVFEEIDALGSSSFFAEKSVREVLGPRSYYQCVQVGSWELIDDWFENWPDRKKVLSRIGVVIATLFGHTSQFAEFVSRGALSGDQDERRMELGRLLELATYEGNIKLVQTLIKMGALSENQDERKVELDNLLNLAMKRGRYEMVPLLLENGASLDSKIASIKKEEGTFKFNVNRDGKRRPGSTLLHMAALADDVEMIEFLLKKSPRLLNEPDDDLVTPVMSTVRFDSYEAFTSLMAHGADVMRVDSSGKAPVHSVGSVAMLRNLIESGVDVNQLTETRSTPLHFVGAAVIPLLINEGADVNAADIHGLTPLHKRVLDIDPEAAKLLIENGANVMAVDERDQTPLHKIASGGNFDGYSGYLEWPIASLLLDAGADVNARDKDGWTPLHHACDHHYTDSYGPELLISRGADVSIKTNDGESAANIAAGQDSRESELLSNRLAWHEEKVGN